MAENTKPSVRLMSVLLVTASLFFSSTAIADSAAVQQAAKGQIASNAENPFRPTVEQTGSHPDLPPLNVMLGETRSLPVTISLSRECYLGDADMILLEAGWSHTPSIRLSLESLLPDDNFVASVMVPVAQLKTRGTKTNFPLPPYQGTRPMGLFICKDSREDGHCRNKPVQSSAELFARYNPDKSPEKLDRVKDIPDKSYFFGNLLAYEDRVEFAKEPFTDKTAARLSSNMEASKLVKREKILSRIKHLHATLGSLPLSERNNEIEITLPSLDLSGCGK